MMGPMGDEEEKESRGGSWKPSRATWDNII